MYLYILPIIMQSINYTILNDVFMDAIRYFLITFKNAQYMPLYDISAVELQLKEHICIRFYKNSFLLGPEILNLSSYVLSLQVMTSENLAEHLSELTSLGAS